MLVYNSRFGNLKDGINDIKNHKWFKNIQFVKLFNQEVDAPSSFLPKSNGLLSNFRKYDILGYKKSSKCLFEKEFDEIWSNVHSYGGSWETANE